MSCRFAAVGLSLGLLSLAPGLVKCSELRARPLQLGFATPSASAAQLRSGAELHANATRFATPADRQEPRAAQAESSLGQRALRSMLAAPEPNRDNAAANQAQSADRFRFERQGPAIRNFSRSYRDICANVSNKIWDEPNGRRIKFDSAGKPGIALVIPLR